MRKLIAIGSIAVLALAVMAAPGVAGKAKQQKVEGNVVMPTPYTDDSGCFAGLHRRGQAAAQGLANGVLGYNFAVDKATWKKPFMLEVTGGQSHVDLDIYFYLGPLTTLNDFVGQGGDPAPPATVSFNTRAAGGEADLVPEAAENVIVCMYGGGQGAGFAADFVYTAGKGVKKPK